MVFAISSVQSCSSVQLIWTHGLQYAKRPCPSPTLRVCSNYCPNSQWCHPAISSSVNPFSPCFQSLPASGSFSAGQFFTQQVAIVLEFQLQHQSFQCIFRTDFLWDGLVWSPYSPRDSQEFSPTPQFKNISSLALRFLYGTTLTSTHDHWKTIA